MKTNQLNERLSAAAITAACPACHNVATQYPMTIRGTDKIDWQCQSCGQGHSAGEIEMATVQIRHKAIRLARTISELASR